MAYHRPTPRHGYLPGLDGDDHSHYLTSVRHSAVDHDGLPIQHDGLEGTTADQHHTEDHALRHASGGVDVVTPAAIGADPAGAADDAEAAANAYTAMVEDRFRSARAATGTVMGTGTADVTVTWPTVFLDTDYTVVASVEQDVASGLRVLRVRSHTTTGCTVQVVNDALGSGSGTVHAFAFHD